MELIFFTKFLRDPEPEKLGEQVLAIGASGLDLAVRAGLCVNPGNVSERLPAAVKIWSRMGLSVPMASLEWDWVDPEKKELLAIYAACAEAGVGMVKLGYWCWGGKDQWPGAAAPFAQALPLIRKSLESFQRLGEKFNLCTLLHTHSGPLYGGSATAIRQLVEGFDLRRIGIYADPAHLAICGEPLPMALDICGSYLRAVGAKNLTLGLKPGGGYTRDWGPLAEGVVNWADSVEALKRVNFQGPLSLHGEYSAQGMSLETRLQTAAADCALLKKLLASGTA